MSPASSHHDEKDLRFERELVLFLCEN